MEKSSCGTSEFIWFLTVQNKSFTEMRREWSDEVGDLFVEDDLFK